MFFPFIITFYYHVTLSEIGGNEKLITTGNAAKYVNISHSINIESKFCSPGQ